MSLIDLFNGSIKAEESLTEIYIPERKIICIKCNTTYMSTSPNVKTYAHACENRALIICPECGKQFSINKELSKFDSDEELGITKERKARTYSEETVAKRAEREAEKIRAKQQREADNTYLKEEAERIKKEKWANMSEDKRIAMEAKVAKMKATRDKNKQRSTEVDPEYL